jgi:hypothetical protein
MRAVARLRMGAFRAVNFRHNIILFSEHAYQV